MIAIVLFTAFLVFTAGMVVTYAYMSQTEYIKRMRLEVEINALRARDLPPRILEVWNYGKTTAHGLYLRSIDADKAVDALALVAAETRAFSETGLTGVLSRREVGALRDELIATGYATWHPSGRSQGIVWTETGKALLITCLNEGARTHTHARSNTKRHPRRGVGEVSCA